MRRASILAVVAALAVAAGCSRGDGSGPSPAPPAAGGDGGAGAGEGPGAAARPREPVPRAEAAEWTAALEAPGPVPAGAPARALLRVTARAGYHVNGEYPASFTAEPGPGADLAPGRIPLGAPAASDPCDDPAHAKERCAVAWELPYTPRGPGEARVTGTLAFSVCNPERCLIEKQRLTAAATVR